MFKPVRVVATIIFLASIALIFVGAFVIRSDVSRPTSILAHLLTKHRLRSCASVSSFYSTWPLRRLTLLPVFVIIEYLAYTWYTLSYIPYARTAVRKVFGM